MRLCLRREWLAVFALLVCGLVVSTITDARTDPKNPKTLLQRGDEAYRAKRFSNAAKLYTDCLRAEPDNVTARYHRGLAHYALKRYGEASLDFERTVKNDPTNARAHYCLGICYVRLHFPNAALEHIKTACDLSPRERYRKALAWLEQRRERTIAAQVAAGRASAPRYADEDSEEEDSDSGTLKIRFPPVTIRTYRRGIKEPETILPNSHSLHMVFDYCYKHGLNANLAVIYLAERGVAPVEEIAGGGIDRGAVIEYRVYDSKKTFYVTQTSSGLVYRWGMH